MVRNEELPVIKHKKFDIGLITDTGNKRKLNQDRVLSIKKNGDAMIAVADGMGGLQNGEEVSDMVIQGLIDWWENNNQFDKLDGVKIKKSLSDEVINLNLKILKYCKENSVRSGTTLTFALILNNVCYYVYSGDTRLYLIRNNAVNQLSHDENLYAYINKINTDENNDRNKSVLISYIGKGDNLSVNIGDIGMSKNDVLVICSDGLYNYFDFDDKKNISMIVDTAPQLAAEKIRDIVKSQDANDNLSMVILKIM